MSHFILANLDKTMFGKKLYNRIKEKVCNLLYIVNKDDPFIIMFCYNLRF